MYTRIVVPLDGSDIAEMALLEAEPLAALMHAPIHLIRVIDVAYREMSSVYALGSPTAISALMSDEVEASEQYVESVARDLDQRGVRVTSEVCRGPVAPELVAAAKPGDLFVMASHGRSGVARWFMGSVAEEVLRHASVPILLVKVSSYTGSHSSNGRHEHLSASGARTTLH